MRLNLNISKRELTIVCGSTLAAVALFFATCVLRPIDTSTPADARHGWSSAAAASEETQAIVGAMPAFAITDDNGVAIVQANERANVRLWHAVLEARGGHLPNVPQQVGDCVSWGAKHAIEYLQYMEMKTGPPGSEFHEVFAPYIYGVSRVLIGQGRLRGEGSCGAWAAKGVTQFGVLRADFENVPAYSGHIARQWGKDGPPQQFIAEAKKFLVQMTSPVADASSIRDAIVNGYPCTIASNIGFDKIVKRDGRLVGVRSGSWSHQMAVIGYDGSGETPYWYILNSWGPDAHGKPLGDEPPGGFWIGERDMTAIAAQGDSFAYSSFAGFKARDFHFDLFSRKENHENHPADPRAVAVRDSQRPRAGLRPARRAGNASLTLGL